MKRAGCQFLSGWSEREAGKRFSGGVRRPKGKATFHLPARRHVRDRIEDFSLELTKNLLERLFLSFSRLKKSRSLTELILTQFELLFRNFLLHLFHFMFRNKNPDAAYQQHSRNWIIQRMRYAPNPAIIRHNTPIDHIPVNQIG